MLLFWSINNEIFNFYLKCISEVHFTFQDIQIARENGIEITAFEAKGTDDSIREKLIQAKRKGARSVDGPQVQTHILKLFIMYLQNIRACVLFYSLVENYDDCETAGVIIC